MSGQKSDLLFLSHRIPFPPNKGDKLRSFHLLKHLSEYFTVHLGCFVDDPADWRYVDQVRAYCAETFFAPLSPGWRKVCSLSGLVLGQALSVGYYRHHDLRNWVDDIRRRLAIRKVLVFSSVMAQYADVADGSRRIADMVDVDSAKWALYGGGKPWPLSWLYRREARTLLRFESRVARSFDATVFVSEEEASLFKRLAGVPPDRVHHAANGVDTNYFQPDPARESPYEGGARVLVFTGAMDYWPNVDAVKWFATEVFPRIRQRWPDTCFAIVGARPTAEVRNLSDRAGVMVTDTVPDVRPYLEHAAVVVAPLRIARGIQNKVLEGMAMGRTVIATSPAAEGIHAQAGEEILIADDGEQYLSALDRVLCGGCDLGAAARTRVVASYSWDANLDRIRLLLNSSDGAHDVASERAAAVA